MRKRIIATLLLIAAMFMVNIVGVYAHTPPVTFNDELIEMEAVIVDGRTLLPARDIVELLGGSIYWDEELRQVTISQPDIYIVLIIDSIEAIVNDLSVELDVPAQIINDRTKVPLRFVAENLGVDIDFVEGTVEISAIMVWLPATGVRWHAVNDCGNMNPYRARRVTLRYAQAYDRIEGPCRICEPPQ